MNARPGDYRIVPRTSVWQEVVGYGGLTLIALGVVVVGWMVAVLVFSLDIANLGK